MVALVFSWEYFFCNSGFSSCEFFADGVLLEIMAVLLLFGRYLAELAPRDADSAFGLDDVIP